MPPDLIEVEVCAQRLGVTLNTLEWTDLERLVTAVSEQIRSLTRRGFEGDEGATYSETHRLDRDVAITLRHVPVTTITSVARVSWGSDDEVIDADDYELEDTERGRIAFRSPRRGRFRVVYRVSGDIPAHVADAAYDWIANRWAVRSQQLAAAGMTGYKTGEDSETWDPSRVGRPPTGVLLSLGLVTHLRGAVI